MTTDQPADNILDMVYRGKPRSVAAVLALAVIAALVAVLNVRRSQQPPDRTTPVPAGKARITRIVDGDTVHALIAPDHAGAETIEEKVRLFGINTPELHPRPGTRKEDFAPEAFAQEACDCLASLCPPGSEVGLALHGRDKYGRLLAVLHTSDGRDANKALIEAGLAKAYFLGGSKKDPLRLEYERAEERAREAKRGLWR